MELQEQHSLCPVQCLSSRRSKLTIDNSAVTVLGGHAFLQCMRDRGKPAKQALLAWVNLNARLPDIAPSRSSQGRILADGDKSTSNGEPAMSPSPTTHGRSCFYPYLIPL